MAEQIDLYKLLKGRRTCRSFKSDPIPEEVMNRLYGAACSAPSAGGFQRISIVEIADQEKKTHLRAFHGISALLPMRLSIWCSA